MEKLPSPLLLSHVKSIRRKIALSFAPDDRSRIAALRTRIWIGKTASVRIAEGYRPPGPACLEEIQLSFFESRKLAITYEDENGGKTHREIAPHFLFLNWPVWYLLAWDDLRDAPRFFRIDRIRAAKVLPGRFPPQAALPFLAIVEDIAEQL
jgi:predicted DNA-binding transcriptional regulator YafY